jgi:hypothetical protein
MVFLKKKYLSSLNIHMLYTLYTNTLAHTYVLSHVSMTRVLSECSLFVNTSCMWQQRSWSHNWYLPPFHGLLRRNCYHKNKYSLIHSHEEKIICIWSGYQISKQYYYIVNNTKSQSNNCQLVDHGGIRTNSCICAQ